MPWPIMIGHGWPGRNDWPWPVMAGRAVRNEPWLAMAMAGHGWQWLPIGWQLLALHAAMAACLGLAMAGHGWPARNDWPWPVMVYSYTKV